MISSAPTSTNASLTYSITGLPTRLTNGFGLFSVSGSSLVPLPPAIIMPIMGTPYLRLDEFMSILRMFFFLSDFLDLPLETKSSLLSPPNVMLPLESKD